MSPNPISTNPISTNKVTKVTVVGDSSNQNDFSSSPSSTTKKLKKPYKLSLAHSSFTSDTPDTSDTSNTPPALKRFHISCSQQDYYHLSSLAKSSGMSLSSYLIEMGLSSSSLSDPKIRLLLESIFYELSFIASNLSKFIKLSSKSLDSIKIHPILSSLHFSSNYLVDLLSSHSFKDLLDTLSGLSLPEASFSPSNALYSPDSQPKPTNLSPSTLQKSDNPHLSEAHKSEAHKSEAHKSEAHKSEAHKSEAHKSEAHKSASINNNLQATPFLFANLYSSVRVASSSDIVHFIPRNVHSSSCSHFYLLVSYPLYKTYPSITGTDKSFTSTSFILNCFAFSSFYSVALSSCSPSFNQLVSYTYRSITNTSFIHPHNKNLVHLFFGSLGIGDFNKLSKVDNSDKDDNSNNNTLLYSILNNQLSPKEATDFSAFISAWPKDSHHQQDSPDALLPSDTLVSSPDFPSSHLTPLVSKPTIAAGSSRVATRVNVHTNSDPTPEGKPKSDFDT